MEDPRNFGGPQQNPSLVAQLARRYTMHLHDTTDDNNSIHIDPLRNVAVTVGASQALFLALQCVIQQGDEVVLMEPFFDCCQQHTTTKRYR